MTNTQNGDSRWRGSNATTLLLLLAARSLARLHRLATTKSRETSGRARDRSRGGGKEPPRTLAHTSIDPSSSSSVAAVARVLRSARINTEYLPDSAQARRRRRRRRRRRARRRRVCSRACARNARPRPSVRSPARRPGEPQLLRCGMTFPSSDVRRPRLGGPNSTAAAATTAALTHFLRSPASAAVAVVAVAAPQRLRTVLRHRIQPLNDRQTRRERGRGRGRHHDMSGCRKLWCKWKGMQRGRTRVRGPGKSLSPVKKRWSKVRD